MPLVSSHTPLDLPGMNLTGKLLGFLCRDGSKMPQIALVSHEHDHNIRIGMIPQFFQPPLHILVCLMF